MYLYEPPLGKEGKKGGREIKDSVYHLTQRQQFIDSFFLPLPLLLANIIYEVTYLIPEKRCKPVDPNHSGCISKGTVTNLSM